MKILIKFPTRGRTFKFFNVLKTYYTMCDDLDNIKFLITLDTDDKLMNQPDVIDMFKEYKNLTYIYGDSKSKIDAINRDIDINDDWDIILLASDDMVPKVKGYDTIIRNKMIEHYPDTDGVLWFNDGHQGNKLNTLCILGKKYYDRFGYIYYPKYHSVWSDNEFMDVANLLGKQIYFEDVIIQHQHPDYGFGERDIVHVLNNNNGGHDGNLYHTRKQKNFEL